MLRGSKRITITTEAVNRYKFWVLTSGIELAQYEKNPIMLFMHNPVTRESLPIGQIVELRVEADGSITGLPLFDDEDEFAVKLYKKYEKGIIKMASAGLIPVEWSDELIYIKEGQELPTLIKSILDEVSLCDRGINNEALTLCDQNGKRIELSVNGENPSIPKLNKQKSINMKIIELKNPTALLTALNLAVDADESAILLAVNSLTQKNALLVASEAEAKQALATKAQELETVQLAVTQEKITELKNRFVSERKATAEEAEALVKLANGNYESLKAVFDARPSQATAQSLFSTEKTDRVAELVKLSFSELHKNGGLAELKELDIEAYKKKIKE